MMLDLGPFSSENYDSKKWINAACQSRHPQEPVDKHFVDMEMKIQMVSEEIAASLEEQSAGALLRVPRATRDVIRLRDDAVSLRSAVSAILQKLKKAEGSSAESIAALAKVDVVKQRMEAAYETLQDAAGLTQLSSTVEDVFASGDLPRAAETLANMRHCLSAVGEVAEFANIRKQLEVLEDRLDTMVQPRLTDALSNRKSANEKNEMERISSSGDFQSALPTISFSSWLPNFYDELLLYLEQEWKWCMIAFPEDYKTLVPRLLSETMMSIGSSFVSHINVAIGDAVPETKALAKGLLDILSGDMQKGIKIQTKHLEALIELHNMTGTFARNIQHLFSDSDVRVLIDVLKAVYLPYESFKHRYGQMERAILSSEIGGVDLRGAVIRGVGAQGIELSETVRRMEESIPQVIILLEAAVERCINFTGGSEADELILALDDIMLQYIATLQDTLKSLRTVCGVDYGSDGTIKKETEKKDGNPNARRVDLISNEEEWSIVQGALQILTVADSLTSRSSVFEASLRATLARLSTSLSFSVFGSSLDQNQTIRSSNEDGEPYFGGRAALDMAALRLVDVPEKARKLLNLLNQSKDPRFHALPHASQRVAAFADTVNELVYDVLISKVRQRLSDVSRLPIWSSVEEQSAFHLPTFSAYPQSYVTSVGEYLLTLPQQLEPLAEGISSSENNDEAQFFATEWMFKVAEGATALYIEQLRGIQHISDRGAQQLSVDIEYLSNVLSALSMPIPAVLATFQSCLSASRDQLKDLLKSDSVDMPTANLVCKMRRVNLDS
ncbi:hypothetical protein AAHE18_03G083700 [Arachis hypogaea]